MTDDAATVQDPMVLDSPWREVFELAWESYKAGSAPCGAVVVDSRGALVSQGRNRAHEAEAPARQLAGTYLAHAELNAIAQLPAGRYPDHSLYTSLEPCLLCLGAVVTCSLGSVRFAGDDPWGGSRTIALDQIPRAVHYMPVIVGPRRDRIGRLGAALFLEWYMRRSPDNPRLDYIRSHPTEPLRLAERLSKRKVLVEAAAAGQTLDQTLESVWNVAD